MACRLSHGLGDLCNLLILGKSPEVVDEPLERLLPGVMNVLLGDIREGPEAAVVGLLAALRQGPLTVFLGVSKCLSGPRSPQVVALRAAMTPWPIAWIKEVVFEGRMTTLTLA